MDSSELCDRWVETARRLLAASPEADLVAAFVFGSAAWGDAHETSDVDMMVLLDRDDDFREVTRVRVSEMANMDAPAPMFADIDRISFERFRAVIGNGGLHHRVVNSVILADDGRYEAIRRQVSAGFAAVEERARRARKREEAARQHLRAAAQARAGDPSLALLHARLAAEEAGIALLEASGNRLSTGHYFDALERALTAVDQGSVAAYAEQLVTAGKAPSVSSVVNCALETQRELDQQADRLWKDATGRADRDRVARMRAHVDAQLAQLPASHRY